MLPWEESFKAFVRGAGAQHLNFYGPAPHRPAFWLLAQTWPAAFDKALCPVLVPHAKNSTTQKVLTACLRILSNTCFFRCIWVSYWHCESEIVTLVWWPTIVAKQICPRGPICPVPPHYTYSSLLTPQDDNWKESPLTIIYIYLHQLFKSPKKSLSWQNCMFSQTWYPSLPI